jgi:hypothetical protein
MGFSKGNPCYFNLLESGICSVKILLKGANNNHGFNGGWWCELGAGVGHRWWGSKTDLAPP